MRLSVEALEMLAQAISDDVVFVSEGEFRDSEEQIIDSMTDFFLNVKEIETLDMPSINTSIDYAVKVLSEYNGTDIMKNIVEEILSPIKRTSWETPNVYYKDKEIPRALAKKFQPYFERDGYKIIIQKKLESSPVKAIYYYHILNENEFAETPEMEKNNQVQDIITTAKERFAREDYKGAISSSFNLVETVIKNILDELVIGYNKNAQFIDIYPKLSKGLNLNPTEENIEGRLEDILKGLKCQVKGLYHLANKASDRHTPKHIPKRQDAKLAMNAAFTLCEYLSDTHKSRQAQ